MCMSTPDEKLLKKNIEQELGDQVQHCEVPPHCCETAMTPSAAVQEERYWRPAPNPSSERMAIAHAGST